MCGTVGAGLGKAEQGQDHQHHDDHPDDVENAVHAERTSGSIQ
jgi:hypothetical protein